MSYFWDIFSERSPVYPFVSLGTGVESYIYPDSGTRIIPITEGETGIKIRFPLTWGNAAFGLSLSAVKRVSLSTIELAGSVSYQIFFNIAVDI